MKHPQEIQQILFLSKKHHNRPCEIIGMSPLKDSYLCYCFDLAIEYRSDVPDTDIPDDEFSPLSELLNG